MYVVILGETMARLFDSLAYRTRFTHCCAIFNCKVIAFGSRIEVISGVISSTFVGPIVPDKHVKFCDPRLNRSREIPPEAEAVGGGIFDGFFRDNIRSKAVSDVISSVAVE